MEVFWSSQDKGGRGQGGEAEEVEKGYVVKGDVVEVEEGYIKEAEGEWRTFWSSQKNN